MKSIAIKIFTIILFTAAGLTFATAQPSAAFSTVNGTLHDDKGKPMDYATVSLLKAADSSVVKGTLSNENGVYVFDHIVNGTYLIKATVVGYEKAVSEPLTVTGEGKITAPQITMLQANHTLNTVTITSTKPLIERKVDRTVMNVENSVLAAGNSALEILERAPGVSVDKDDNISLKGKQGVTVMINDKLTYLSSSQLATLLRSTDGTTIQSIEIISNPSAKYDAAGNSGIINIKLKKNRQSGTNGSVTVGVGKGKYGRDNSTLQLNHKVGGLNLFGSFSHDDNKRFQDIGLKRIVTSPDGSTTYFNQYTGMPQTRHNNSYRLGADYSTSSKNTLGFVMNGYFNSENDENDNHTNIGSSFTQVDSSLRTVTSIHQKFRDFSLNLNDTYKIDTLGQQISADIDYSKYRNNSTAQYVTDFFLADGSQQHPQAFLGNLTPSVIDIRTAKVDYSNPISKTLKMEAGFKLSDVKTDNDLQEKNAAADNYASVNHFIYDEKIDAAYLNFNKDYKGTSVQVGVRAEYTRSNATGDSSNVVQQINRHYLNLFPSVFLNHTFNDKNELSFSYSRRIDRPQYDNLNPFVYHLDPYTYEKGNPYLKPQYTNNFELNYTYNKNTTLTLGYNHTTDVMTEVPSADPVTKVAFVTQQNLQEQTGYNINLYSSYTITKWWSGDLNATGFYLAFKSMGLEGGNLDKGQAAFQVRATETFTPFKGYRFELTPNYQSALTYGLFSVKPQYSVDAGVSHSFANKRANLKFSMSDIFNTRRNDVSTNYQNVNLDVRQKRDSQVARLTFTYSFGNSKIKTRQHRSGADDERGRVKGN
ncbi:MAG TPA: outer membrane beta-barrel family protein [Mucilaginibacter sp.]|nr:outer membrane beta-barrel family protein [Mucilaginibacter sp.]